MPHTFQRLDSVIFRVKQTEEFTLWLEKLPLKTRFLVTGRVQRIAECGHFGDFKIFEGLLELRWKSGLRVYSSLRSGSLYLLLHGGNKNGQERDIRKAKKILEREVRLERL